MLFTFKYENLGLKSNVKISITLCFIDTACNPCKYYTLLKYIIHYENKIKFIFHKKKLTLLIIFPTLTSLVIELLSQLTDYVKLEVLFFINIVQSREYSHI